MPPHKRGGGHAIGAYASAVSQIASCALTGHAAAAAEVARRKGMPEAPLQHLQPPLACSPCSPFGSPDIRADGPTSPTSINKSRASCAFDLCISAALRHIMRGRPITCMPSRAHRMTAPPLSCRKRVHEPQGQCEGGIGWQGGAGGYQASAILRTRAQASDRRPSGPPPCRC